MTQINRRSGWNWKPFYKRCEVIVAKNLFTCSITGPACAVDYPYVTGYG